MSPPKTHTFNGKKYHLIFEKLDGMCDAKALKVHWVRKEK